MGLFDPRVEFKPFEYPDLIQFKEAIRNSYWVHTEYNYSRDVDDFHQLGPVERGAVKNAMLAISQIEVSVKRFWAKLGERFPKAEFDQVGGTFADSEIRHADAYSHLLEILGLNADFRTLLDVPVIKNRVEYLSKYLKGVNDPDDKKYTMTLTLFSIFVENVSLFSQFLILKSFYRHQNILKGIDNAVDATLREEEIHALFGVHLLSLIKAEKPEWFDEEFYDSIELACRKAYDAEVKIIDWIFEEGELEFLSKESVVQFIRQRFNWSLSLVGAPPIFDVNDAALGELEWFYDELTLDVNSDFFDKRPVSYSKSLQSITAEDLF